MTMELFQIILRHLVRYIKLLMVLVILLNICLVSNLSILFADSLTKLTSNYEYIFKSGPFTGMIRAYQRYSASGSARIKEEDGSLNYYLYKFYVYYVPDTNGKYETIPDSDLPEVNYLKKNL